MKFVGAGGLAAALLAFASLVPEARADAASEALVRSFVEQIDKSVEWQASAARIASEGNLTILDGLKISLEHGELIVEAGKLTFEGLSAGGGTTVFAGLTVGDVGVFFETGSVSVPLLTVTKMSLPSLGGWSFDEEAPFASMALAFSTLARLEFNEVSVPAAHYHFQFKLGSEPFTDFDAKTTNIRLSNMANGVLALQTMEKMEFTTRTPDDRETLDVSRDSVVRNLNFDALAHVFDPTRYKDGRGDGRWLTVLESTSDGRYESSKSKFSIGGITTSSWQVRQTPTPFVSAFDTLIALGESPDEAKVLDLLEAHFSDLVGWFRIGLVKVEKLAAAPPDGGSVELDSLSFEDISSDGMKRMALVGLAANAPEFTGKLASLSVEDVVWPSFKAIIPFAKLEELKKPGSVPDPALVAAAAESFFEMFPTIGRLAIAGVSVAIPGVEAIALHSYEWTNDGGSIFLPRKTRSRLDTLTIPGAVLRMEAEAAAVFDALGYDKLVIGADGGADLDEASGDYAARSAVSVEEAGNLSLAYDLGGLTRQTLQAIVKQALVSGEHGPDPAQLIPVLGELSFKGLRLRYEDASLVRRLLPFLANMQGTGEQALVANATAMLQLMLSQFGRQELATAAVEAVKAFAAEPKSLTLILKPASPLKAADFLSFDPNNPAAAIDRLGISITAND